MNDKYRPHPGAQTDFMNSKDKRDYSILIGGSGSGSKTALRVHEQTIWMDIQRVVEEHQRRERNARSKSHHNAV